MLASSRSVDKPQKVLFDFWVRSFADAFYEDEIREIGKEFEEFEYVQYFSREPELTNPTFEHSNIPTIKSGYVTDWITEESVKSYEEYYICGSPAMVKSAREKLEALGIEKVDILWEQF